MGEIYEQLERLFGDRKGEGMTTLDMMRLPPSVRIIVQLMLRNRAEMTYPAISEAIGKMPEDKRPSQAELDEVLDAMTRLDLLNRMEQKKVVTYKLNLGPSSSGTRAPSRPGGEAGKKHANEVWDSLGSDEPDTGGDDGGFFRRMLGGQGSKPSPDE